MQKRLATAVDSPRLIDFHRQFPIDTSVLLKVDRHENYFTPYQNQADYAKTFLLEEGEQLEASASFLFKKAQFQDKIKKLAFIKDIRVGESRKALLHWTNQFTEIMQNVAEQDQVDSFFALIGEAEFRNLNQFVRPRQLRKALPRYFLYRSLELVSVHGVFPWVNKPIPSIKIKSADPSLREKLLAYLLRKSQYRSFRFFWDENTFDEMIARIDHFELNNFLVALDYKEDVIGCLSLWSSGGIEDYIPMHYNLRGHNFRQFLKLMNIFRLSRGLPKPVSRTGIEDYLQFQYLNHIYCDNENVFESLLWYAFYERCEAKEFLVYPRFDSHIMLKSPRGWLTSEHPYFLYCVVLPDQATPDFVHPRHTFSPDIELFSL